MTRAPRLRVVCAESLALGREIFSALGDVVTLPETEIDRAAVRDADILVTRSKTRIDDALIEGSRLKFYGTATAGYDHVDADALERRDIAWTEAAGCNANSVAEYVIAALARVGLDRGIDWTGKTIGIVGAGHIGSRLAALAPALGLNVLLNDPPLHDRTGDAKYLPLHHILAESDIVTLHVPLTDNGPHPTRGMVDASFFSRVKRGALFINASRGEAVREDALLAALRDGICSDALLDVFDHEPDIDRSVMNAARIATPHIAGYSYDGRVRGTEMVFDAACEALGLTPARPDLPPREVRVIDPQDSDVRTGLYRTVLSAYDPGEDDARLRAVPEGESMGTHFKRLRAGYPKRLEFDHYRVEAQGAEARTVNALRMLGFDVQTA